MSREAVQVLAAVVLAAHGLGHALALFPLLGWKLGRSHSADSPLLGGAFSGAMARGAGAVLHGAALLTFLAAGMALGGWGVPPGAWEVLAVTASILSLLGLLTFWNGLPFLFPNKLGVLAVDALVILSVLWLRWPASLYGS